MGVVPVGFGSGTRFVGSVGAPHRWADPEVVMQGERVLHLGPEGSLDEHELNDAAVVDGDRITYPAIQTSLDV